MNCKFSVPGWFFNGMFPPVGASLVAQTVKKLSARQETWVQSLGWEHPLEKGMTTHSNILAWRIPWTEEPGRHSLWGCEELDTTEPLTLSFAITWLKQQTFTSHSLEAGKCWQIGVWWELFSWFADIHLFALSYTVERRRGGTLISFPFSKESYHEGLYSYWT